jgi:hypothetical protein
MSVVYGEVSKRVDLENAERRQFPDAAYHDFLIEDIITYIVLEFNARIIVFSV